MVPPAGVGVVLGQDDAVAAHLVDGADMLAVRADHVEMLADVSEQVALALPRRAPAREFILEFRPVLAPIFVIVTVERGDLARAPAVIVAVAMVGAATLVEALVIVAPPLGFLVAEPRADLVAGTLEEAAILLIMALRPTALEAAPAGIAPTVVVIIGMRIAADILEPTPVGSVAAMILGGDAIAAIAACALLVVALAVALVADVALAIAAARVRIGIIASGSVIPAAVRGIAATIEIAARITFVTHLNLLASIYEHRAGHGLLPVIISSRGRRRSRYRPPPGNGSSPMRGGCCNAVDQPLRASLPATVRARGAVAQMGERCNRTAEVKGSIPFGSTTRARHLHPLRLSTWQPFPPH